MTHGHKFNLIKKSLIVRSTFFFFTFKEEKWFNCSLHLVVIKFFSVSNCSVAASVISVQLLTFLRATFNPGARQLALDLIFFFLLLLLSR